MNVIQPLAVLMLASLLSTPASAVCEATDCLQKTHDYAMLEYGRSSSIVGHVITDAGAFSQSTYDTAITCSGRWIAVLLQEPTSGRLVPVTVGCAQMEAGHVNAYGNRVLYNAGVTVAFVTTDAQAYAASLLA